MYPYTTVLHKRTLEHTTANVSCKKYYEGNLKATKTEAFKYIKKKILICYLIHANIYKHKIFVIRYKQYISHIAAIAEF